MTTENTWAIKKLFEQLEKRVEAVENQNFAQRLLIDEMEKTIQELKGQLERHAYPPYTSSSTPLAGAAVIGTMCAHTWNPLTHTCSKCGFSFIKIHSTP